MGEAISALHFCRADFCWDHYAILRLGETIFPLFYYLADIYFLQINIFLEEGV